MNKKPSCLRVFFTDNSSIFLFGLTIILLVPVVTIPLSFLTLFLLIKRIGGIRKTFGSGVPVQATITQKRYRRGYWLVVYQYDYEGKRYENQNMIVRFGLRINRGDTLEAYILPDKLEGGAFLSKFYL